MAAAAVEAAPPPSAAPQEQQGEAVQLYVYDLSNGLARAFSQMLLGRQIDAVYHTSIVVGGQEFYFGGGVSCAPAGHTPFGQPIEVLDLGRTQLPREVRDELLAELCEEFTPDSYRLFSHNCNNFSDRWAQLLTGNCVPPHITGLPDEVLATPFGQMLQPMLAGLEQQLGSMRQQAYRPAIAAAAAAALADNLAVAGGEPPAMAEAAPAAPAAAAPSLLPSAAAAVAAEGAEAEGPALHAAEVEIEAAVGAGMMREAEAALESMHLPPSEAARAAARVAAQGRDARLAAELEVEAEYGRLLAAGVPQHDAQAQAVERVAAARGGGGGQEGGTPAGSAPAHPRLPDLTD